jgi:hypothetical protein
MKTGIKIKRIIILKHAPDGYSGAYSMEIVDTKGDSHFYGLPDKKEDHPDIKKIKDAPGSYIELD